MAAKINLRRFVILIKLRNFDTTGIKCFIVCSSQIISEVTHRSIAIVELLTVLLNTLEAYRLDAITKLSI